MPAEYIAATAAEGAAARPRPEAALLQLTGRDRQTFLQGMVSNDVLSLLPGHGVHAAFLDSTAHLLADLRVHCREDRLLVETDRACVARLAATLEKYLIMEKVRITDVSADWGLTSVCGGSGGALAASASQGLLGFSASRPCGPVTFTDVWLPTSDVSTFRSRLLERGAVTLSEETYHVLRVEAGVPSWGYELDESVLLPEAGMADAVSYTKGCYIGQEIVARIAARGHTNRALRAVLLAEREAAPHPGDTVHLPQDAADAGREIGRITSGAHSPRFGGRALALAYIRREQWDPGTNVSVSLRQPNAAVFPAPGVLRMPGE